MPELSSVVVILRVVLGAAAACLGAFVIVYNWGTIFRNASNTEKGINRNVSPVPVVGPILMIAGISVASWGFSPYVLAVLLADWTTFIIPLALRDIFRS